MTSAPVKLKIPAQDQAAPTRFTADVAAVTNWLRGLGGGAPPDELAAALQELNRCVIAPQVRYDIAEALRPQVEQAARPQRGPARANSLSVVQRGERAGNLYMLLGTAYTIAAVEVLTRGGAANPARLACEAIHRALLCGGREVLQTSLLYRPLHMYGWKNLHQLYMLAEQQKIATLPVPDPAGVGATIKDVYLQAILLGCCQPNRLRQSDLAALYGALANWSQRAQLRTTPDDNTLFVIDLDSDQPPLYRDLVPEEANGRRVYLDTEQLLNELRELHQQAAGTGATIEQHSRLPLNILEQVIAGLGSKRSRSYKRVPSGNSVAVSLGMNNCHFHVASGLIFEQVLYGVVFEASRVVREERFTPPLPNSDIWQQANPHEDFAHSLAQQAGESIELDEASRARVFRNEETDELEERVAHYPVYRAPLADVSPGGYCLDLDPAFPGELRTGELACLREGNDKHWQIAVIRWLYRPSESRLLAGLELLSPRALAFGACIHDKSGAKAPPVRALLLPQIKVIGQQPTLLTPRAGFRVRQKVTLVTADETLTVHLTELVSYTGSYSQFQFKPVRELGDVLAEDNNELTGGTDSLWTTS